MSTRYESFSKFPDAGLALFAAAMDASIDGIVITDNMQADNPIIYCNKAFELLTGYSYEEIVGRNCRFLQANDREQNARTIIRSALQNEQYVRVEVKNYKKDGTPFWNELSISPVTSKEGAITHYIGIQNDITQRKNADTALQDEKDHLEDRVQERTKDLQESENYLLSIVETIRESLLVLDDQMQILSANEHFCKFFQIQEHDFIGRLLFDLEDGVWDIPELKNLLQNVLPHNNPFEGFEMSHAFPNIGKKVLTLNARQIVYKGKFQNRILLAIEDITELRRIEQRKEDFITIASHEMKTPLTTIKGHIQLLEVKAKRNQDETYSASLAAASRSVDRLGVLINDLLDVAHLQLGSIPFHYSEFAFDELVNEAVAIIQSGTKTHKIIINGKTERVVNADFSRLEQVLINLISNAVKYSPQATTVEVKVTSKNNQVEVAVIDYGVGISQDDLPYIFDRFYRAENTTYVFEGMGIGLYICKQIIEEHQGILWVESEKDKGSVFTFTIPVDKPN